MTITSIKVGNQMHFDIEKCGVKQSSAAIVIPWEAKNPQIHFTQGLDIDTVYAILNEIERLKNETRR
jgi:hypothetical protein